ncbi:MAG: hypothetical protein V3V10_01360 [Planctomycetota bacterium]
MRLKYILPALMLALTTTPLLALEDGDLAPRGSLLYARIGDLSKANDRLSGADWKEISERMLMLRNEREFEKSEVFVSELRKFVDKFGRTEIAIADVMVRQPFVQMAVISRLKEGSPTKFSKEFQEFLADADRDMKVSDTSFSIDDVSVELKGGLFILTLGGMMKIHVEDVLDGFNEEALSQTKRFQDWNESANSDVVAFADMKAWRNALDRLGEDFDSDARRAMEYVEWQKWDYISATVDLPSETGGGISASIDLVLSQPFERLNALMKPAGGSNLAANLPAETLGFITAQLGNNHESTYMDLLHFFHDIEQEERPARLKRRISWKKSEIEDYRERLKEAEENDDDKDEDEVQEATEVKPADHADDGADDEWDEKAYYEERIAELEKQIKSYEEELKNASKREMQLDKEQRTSDESVAEQVHDHFGQTLQKTGFTREDIFSALGQEFIMGIVGLPDPRPDDDDTDIFEEMWFVAAESGDNYESIKEKLLDLALGRNLPADMSEDEKEDRKRAAETFVLEKVNGGELIRIKDGYSDFCAFGNDKIFGVAANEEVAKMILAASAGSNRLDTAKLPGGAMGSKYAYANIGEIVARLMDGEYWQDVGYRNFPRPFFDVRKYFPDGAHVSLASAESGTSITFTLDTRNIANLNPVLVMAEDELAVDKKRDHDRDELYLLSSGISEWYIANAEKLGGMQASERATTLAKVSPESLIKDGFFSPQDGLRSAFDPALEDRLQAAWKAQKEIVGPAEEDTSATDLSESGFTWFGLPENMVHGQIICASKKPWMRGGYMCLVLNGGKSSDARTNVEWLQEDVFNALLAANAEGLGYNGMKEPESEPLPLWKVKRRFRQKSRDLNSLVYDLQSRIQTAKDEGRVMKGDFVGAEEIDAEKELREFLGMSEDDWLEVNDVNNLTIKINADGTFTARYEQDGHWIEINEKSQTTASWDK